jgi:hypothetical protein
LGIGGCLQQIIFVDFSTSGRVRLASNLGNAGRSLMVAFAPMSAPKLEPRIMRNELTDYESATIKPLLVGKTT